MTSGSVDLLYFIYAPYTQQKFYLMTIGFLVARFLSIFLIGQYFFSKYVRNYKSGLSKSASGGVVDDDQLEEQDEKGKSSSRKELQNREQG